MTEQFEFDENELYGEPGLDQADPDAETDEQPEPSEENELAFSEDEAEGSAKDSLDIASDRPGSAASSSTHLEIPTDSKGRLGQSLAGPGLHASRLPPTGPARRTTSLPESNAKLGASVPINIPYMGSWRNDFSDTESRPPLPQTFVPPHQLNRNDDFSFSFTGASPSANLKREKLRARNMILQRTGFLEPEKADNRSLESEHHHLPAVQNGGLSAAFGARQFNGP